MFILYSSPASHGHLDSYSAILQPFFLSMPFCSSFLSRFVKQGEEGALSLTTKDRSPDAVVKGRPLNFVSGFRRQKASTADPEGMAGNFQAHCGPL